MEGLSPWDLLIINDIHVSVFSFFSTRKENALWA